MNRMCVYYLWMRPAWSLNLPETHPFSHKHTHSSHTRHVPVHSLCICYHWNIQQKTIKSMYSHTGLWVPQAHIYGWQEGWDFHISIKRWALFIKSTVLGSYPVQQKTLGLLMDEFESWCRHSHPYMYFLGGRDGVTLPCQIWATLSSCWLLWAHVCCGWQHVLFSENVVIQSIASYI